MDDLNINPFDTKAELTQKEYRFVTLHVYNHIQEKTVLILSCYREYPYFHTHLLARKINKKYEYSGKVVEIFSDLDFGVIVIASGFDHPMNVPGPRPPR